MSQSTEQSAIVTGGAARVGRDIALALAGKGFNIGLHYNSSEPEAQVAKTLIEESGRKCVLLQADLCDPAALASVIDRGAQALPGVSVLINNASVFQQKHFLETDLAVFERNFAVHVRAPFFLTAQFAKVCGQGNVINILDMMVAKGNVDYFAYLLSKKSLWDFTKMAAAALAPKVRVNAIAPGSIFQPIDEADPDYMQKRAKQVPLGIPGSPAYIVQGIEFFLQNPFVTGDCIFIDGGAHL
jgi:NAD(P)-dependent dehydrogenase (short-subunit alcohol dehydrogenase family)